MSSVGREFFTNFATFEHEFRSANVWLFEKRNGRTRAAVKFAIQAPCVDAIKRSLADVMRYMRIRHFEFVEASKSIQENMQYGPLSLFTFVIREKLNPTIPEESVPAPAEPDAEAETCQQRSTSTANSSTAPEDEIERIGIREASSEPAAPALSDAADNAHADQQCAGLSPDVGVAPVCGSDLGDHAECCKTLAEAFAHANQQLQKALKEKEDLKDEFEDAERKKQVAEENVMTLTFMCDMLKKSGIRAHNVAVDKANDLRCAHKRIDELVGQLEENWHELEKYKTRYCKIRDSVRQESMLRKTTDVEYALQRFEDDDLFSNVECPEYAHAHEQRKLHRRYGGPPEDWEAKKVSANPHTIVNYLLVFAFLVAVLVPVLSFVSVKFA